MTIRIEIFIIILSSICTISYAYPLKIDRALIKETQQILVSTFGNRYPLSCYEESTHLLLQLDQRLRHSLRVESSEFEKNSLLYVQRLLSEFALFSYKAKDGILKYERDIVYISFLIQHTYLFFERHAPSLLKGRNRPVAPNQQHFTSNEYPPVTHSQNVAGHTVFNGIFFITCASTIYIVLKRYFLSSMVGEVQKFKGEINKVLRVNDDAELKISSIVEDVLICKGQLKSVEEKLKHLESTLEKDMAYINNDIQALLKSYKDVIASNETEIKEKQDVVQKNVNDIDKCCSSINERTDAIEKDKGLLDTLLKPYKAEKRLWGPPISSQDLCTFFGKK